VDVFSEPVRSGFELFGASRMGWRWAKL
jgi:hypothetical protein